MVDSKKILFKNTFFLYLLTFSTQLISFLLVPYETRILQPEKFGLLSVATATMTYFQLVIDFGFMLSATEEVSRNREDKKKLSVIFSSVTYSKIILMVISFILLLIVCNIVPKWAKNKMFFILMFLSTTLNSFIPDYLYRGIEFMKVITLRTVAIKVFFATMIFIFVKEPNDYIYIPLINIFGTFIALLSVYIHLKYKLGISLVICSFEEQLKRLKCSFIFFFSRIATTLYTVSNTVILNLFFGNITTAYYTSAEKIISTAKSALSPISDSLYPYMVKNKDFKIVKKILLIIEPIIILGCIIVFAYAELLCTWLFGVEYSYSFHALRALLPIVVFILPNYVLGFPVLGAMGLTKHANYSVIVASTLHIVNLIILYATENLNMITLGIATSIAEGFIMMYRVIVVCKYKKIFKGE